MNDAKLEKIKKTGIFNDHSIPNDHEHSLFFLISINSRINKLKMILNPSFEFEGPNGAQKPILVPLISPHRMRFVRDA